MPTLVRLSRWTLIVALLVSMFNVVVNWHQRNQITTFEEKFCAVHAGCCPEESPL